MARQVRLPPRGHRSKTAGGICEFPAALRSIQLLAESSLAPGLVGFEKTASGNLISEYGNSSSERMPRQAERLQGFSDDLTLVAYNCKLAADEPRALGIPFRQFLRAVAEE